MYSTITSLPLGTVAITEVPAFGAALVIAEIFYKFHSFTLELVAFLVTWFVLGWAARQLYNLFVGQRSA